MSARVFDTFERVAGQMLAVHQWRAAALARSESQALAARTADNMPDFDQLIPRKRAKACCNIM